MRKLKFSLIMASLLAITSLANASLINFQSESVGKYSNDTTTLLVDGVSVRFSGLGLNIRDISSSFPSGASRVLSSLSDSQMITMELLGGATTNSLTFHNWISGVYTWEIDEIFAQAFDASNNLLGSVTSSHEFIALNFNGMSRITFNDLNEGTGFVLDDLRFTTSAVPEPNIWALMMVGLIGLTIVHRRNKSA
ncbi:MAG: PEP-CTERM sorting domain-containing protein [Nitrosomonas sp.]|nr:MAG: PEP-CTERM sorting domain-containing protein [Nitrosomonas sp.]